MKHSPRRSLLIFLAVPLYSLLLYINTLDCGFVWDDRDKIVRIPFPPEVNLRTLFTPDYWIALSHEPEETSFYRPLVSLSFVMDRLIWGDDPSGYHLHNMLIHMLVSLAVSALCLGLTGDREASLAAGLLFASHPVHTEAVTFVSSRTTLYSTLFGLLAFLCLLRQDGRARREAAPPGTKVPKCRKWLVLSLFFLTLAFFSKEEAFVFPFIFLAYLALSPPSDPESGRGRLLGGVPYLVLLGLLLSVRLLVVRGTEMPGCDVSAALKTAATVFGLYLRILILPYPLNADYGTIDALQGWSMLSSRLFFLLFLPLVPILALRAPRSRFLLAWYFLGLLPFSNLLPIPQYFAERYIYLSSIPAAIATYYFVERLVEAPGALRRFSPRYRRLVLLFLVAAYGLLTVSRNTVWVDDRTLFDDSSRKLPGNARARYNHGLALVGQGEIEEGIAEIEESVHLNPLVAKSRVTLAELYAGRGEIDRALGEYGEILRIDSSSFPAHNNIGILLGKTGNHREAIGHLERARAIDPGNYSVHNNLGIAHRKMGSPGKSEESFLRALRLKPRDAEVLENLGNLMFDTERHEEALACYREAVSSGAGVGEGDPPRILYKIGLIYHEKLNDPDEAARWWRRFLDADPRGMEVDRVRRFLEEGH